MCVASIVGYKSSQLKQNSQRTVQIYCQYIYAEIIVRNMPNVSSLCPPEDIKHQICGENGERNGLNCVYLHHGIEYSLLCHIHPRKGHYLYAVICYQNSTMKSLGQKPWLLPQPVLIIGTYDMNGNANAMNAAWGGQWDNHEIMISMGNHQTTLNLNERGEFTVAFATAETMTASDFVGIVSQKNDPDKMLKTGWATEKAPNVDAPVFTVFPMTLECRIKEKLDESATGYYIIAEVVNVLCNESFFADDGKPDVEKMNLIVFDPVHLGYMRLGQTVGKAFNVGKQLK